MEKYIKDLVHESAAKAQRSASEFYPGFAAVKLQIRVDFSPRRRGHMGGMYAKGPGINMGGFYFLRFKLRNFYGISKFIEYESFRKDPIIGDAFCSTLEQYVALNTGHEVAHACQMNEKVLHSLTDVKPHGTLFKNIYKTIRLDMNKELPDQLEAEKKYNSFIRDRRKEN